MADKKVYGMYENKCKEEVIPMVINDEQNYYVACG